MGKCRVVHFRKEPYDIMIDRTTKWGCPFSHIRDRKTKAKFLVNSRKEAIEAYREWITKGESAIKNIEDNNTLVFVVNKRSNKKMVKENLVTVMF